ncbi:amine sulfotransferase-like isoform X2 [Anoplopoma fimbria]|uniref:amine sulfotransferase-like isoform X2 n=1 Tax=Anoplopoma fimbria TaxID=229290 RepID=UPI0023ECABB3|nr:amine sulfotransferase-like isoform X2 [Anoplopoma fimbria]
MEVNYVKTHDHDLVPHKGFKLINGTHDPDDVDQIYNLEIRDSDVFVVTYPKSGTIWMQQIVLLLEAKGDLTAISKLSKNSNADLIPWIEVIYVARNPKDVIVSYFYFHKLANMLETPKDFDDFFEKFMRGNVFGCSWFEHIKMWHSHQDDMNMLFITYEEMIQDLHSVVERIALFLGKELTDEQMANVVKHSTFNNMKKIPQANYEQVPGELLSHHQGRFMRKGTIGDWKNHFTVAQNEMFDEVFHREMADIPLVFIWDIRDIE